VYSLGETIVEQSVTGSPPGRLGNRSPDIAPHGAFRCAGDDRWITIAVWSDEEWRALSEASGISEERFASNAGRLAGVDDLERAFDAWTQTQDRDALADRLQAVGIEANPVQDLGDCYHDPQLAHREHFHRMTHPAMGEHDYEALGFRLGGSPPSFTRPGPTLGRDNEEVYKKILGLSDDEYERLAEVGAFD